MFETYQNILDQAFRAQVPGWDELSPLDPMKTIAEALAVASSQIEREQSRQIELVLESIPSLVGLHRKTATPARAVFRVQPAKNALGRIEIPAGAEFLMNGGDAYAVSREKVTVYPATVVREDRNLKSLIFDLNVRGELPELKFFYVATAGARKVTLLDLKLEFKGSSCPLFLGDVQWLDETLAGTASGHIIVRPRGGQNAVLCPANTTLRLELVYDGELPSGAFHFNGAYFDIVALASGAEIGILQGQSWEECPLHESVLTPPSSVLVILPDGRERALELVALNPLQLRAVQPEAFLTRYFYCAARHSLVFPAAHLLKGALNGSIQVIAPKLMGLTAGEPGKGTLYSEPTLPIERIEPSGHLVPAVPRESADAFFGRFHAWVRQSLLQPAMHGAAYLTDLAATLQGIDGRIRAVEIKADHSRKLLNFFFLFYGETSGSVIAAPSADLLSKITEKISQLCPLDYTWQIEKFRETKVEIRAQLELETPDNAALIPEAELEAALASAVEKALEHESLLVNVPLARDGLAERIQRRLNLTGEARVKVSLRSLPDGVSLSTLIRDPGTALRAQVQSKTTQIAASQNTDKIQEGVAR